MSTHFYVQMDSLKEIEAALGMMKDKSKEVLRAAINQTAKDIVKILPNEASDEYFLRQTEARKTLDTKKATVANLEAVVTSRGKTLELYGSKISPKKYNPHNRPAAGHTANVKIANNPGALVYKSGEQDGYRAFVVRYESGHVSIARRIPGKYMEEGWLKKKYGWKPGKKKKEALKNLRTSSIPNMLYQILGGEEGIYNENQEKIEEMLLKSIQEQLVRFVK